MVIAVNSSQDGVVEGGSWAVGAFGGAAGVLTALAAEDLPEGGAHLLVAVGVDDGVHGRVELGKQEEEFLVGQNITLWTAHIEKQQDQSRGPADDKGTYKDRERGGEDLKKRGQISLWSQQPQGERIPVQYENTDIQNQQITIWNKMFILWNNQKRI